MTIVQVVEEQNTAAIRDLCRALRQHKLLESPHLHVRSLALEVSPHLLSSCTVQQRVASTFAALLLLQSFELCALVFCPCLVDMGLYVSCIDMVDFALFLEL